MTEKKGTLCEPIFVVGCGRSGTSLLRRLLNQHRDIGIPLESLFIVDYLQASARLPLARMVGMIVREPELQEWGIKATAEDLEGCGTIAEAIDRLHRLYIDPKGKTRWGQKTPRFVRNLPLLQSHFPQARFVHLVRDPRAVAGSLVRSNVHRSTAFYGARRWKMDVQFGLSFEQASPSSVLRLRYEDLVARPGDSLRRVCDFCAVEFDPAMLAPPASTSLEYSDFYSEIHTHVGRPASQAFVDRWTSDLSDQEVAVIESVAAELMDRLGYERVSNDSQSLPSTLRARGDRVIGLAQQTFRYLRYRPRYLFFLVYRKARLGLLRSFVWSVNY